jgi:hypothetical protein
MSDGVRIEWLGGNCPVQAEGTFDGYPFYFRARGTAVTCDVGDWTWDGPAYEWPDAGWIGEELARAYIGEAYRRWLRRETPDAKRDAEYRRENGLSAEMMHAIRWAGFLERELGETARPAIARLMAYAEEMRQHLTTGESNVSTG